MAISTIVGIVGGLAMIIMSTLTSGGHLRNIWNIPSVLMTVLGSYFSMWVSAPLKKVIGMFNGKAFIHIMKSRRGVTINETTKMKDIKQFLYLDMNDGVRYIFVKETDKLDQLSQLFKRTKQGKAELLIVTKTGDKFEPILGVISPHNILERG